MAAEPPARVAAALARRCVDCLQDEALGELAGLFDDDARWELAFDVGEITGERRTVRGSERIARFHRRLLGTVSSTRFYDVEVDAASDELAFVSFRSEVRTRAGSAYGNRYLCRVRSHAGRITHWLEFFDPRAAETIRTEMAAG